jgi:hypothetical protein
MENEVVLSVDPNYSLQDGDYDLDLWMVESPANLALAATIRESDRLKSVTVFINRDSSIESTLWMLPSVFEHHPRATAVIVRGLLSEAREQLILDTNPIWAGSIVAEEVVFRCRL